MKSVNPYVDFRMEEWRMAEQSPGVQTSVRRVLNELSTESLLRLKDPKFEVMARPEKSFSVWAYFPIHRNLRIARELGPKPETRVLLVFSTASLRDKRKFFEDCLRDHLGHVLLYLRSPKARNECPDAQEEWYRSVR